MPVVQFSTARIPESEDITERSMHAVIDALATFEAEALDTTSIGRCVQLHERLFVLAQLLEATDGTVRHHWDNLLAQGNDY